MLKKVCMVLLIAVIVSVFSISALATGEGAAEGAAGTSTEPAGDEAVEKILGDLISDASLTSTEQFLVTITRPGGNETIYKKLDKMTYLICGNTEETEKLYNVDRTDIEVILAKYDGESDTYEEFKDVDGISRWGIGNSQWFKRVVQLGEGEHKLKIIAYKKSQVEDLKPGENLQVNYFTLTVKKESIKEKILNSVIKLTDMIEDFLNK